MRKSINTFDQFQNCKKKKKPESREKRRRNDASKFVGMIVGKKRVLLRALLAHAGLWMMSLALLSSRIVKTRAFIASTTASSLMSSSRIGVTEHIVFSRHNRHLYHPHLWKRFHWSEYYKGSSTGIYFAAEDDSTTTIRHWSSGGGGGSVSGRRVTRRKRSSPIGVFLTVSAVICGITSIIHVVHSFTASTIQTRNHHDLSALQLAVNSDTSESEVSSSTSSPPSSDLPSSSSSSNRPPCFWKPKGGGESDGSATAESKKSTKPRARGPRWQPRVHLDDLKVGDRLDGAHVVQELLDGKTGPKIFVECGVGRTSPKKKTKKISKNENNDNEESSSTSSNNNKDDGDDYDESWSIVYGMVRLGHKGMKSSVIRKRSAKLRSRDSFRITDEVIRYTKTVREVT